MIPTPAQLRTEAARLCCPSGVAVRKQSLTRAAWLIVAANEKLRQD